jgi:hypothetical protein
MERKIEGEESASNVPRKFDSGKCFALANSNLFRVQWNIKRKNKKERK